jgi:hypothetical protein
MKKLIILLVFAITKSTVFAQWQEITKYGPVKDFLYLNENLQYIHGDTFYRVENGKDIIVPDWGFNNTDKNDFLTEMPADFIKGTLIGFKRKTNALKKNCLDVYKTTDGGKSWKIFASKCWVDTLFYLAPIALDSETVFFYGKFFDPVTKAWDYYPWLKVRENSVVTLSWDKFYHRFAQTIAVIDTSTWYVTACYSPIYKIIMTKDGGNSWAVMNSTYFNTNINTSPGKFIIINKQTFLCLTSYRLSITIDSGRTWKTIEKSNYYNGRTDTIYSSSLILGKNTLYLKGDFDNINPTYFLLKGFDSITKEYDSTIIKPARQITGTYDEKCFIFNTAFYKNTDPINHPLSENEKTEKTESKNIAYFSGNNLIINLPPGEDISYSLNLFDYTGKLLFETKISQTGDNVQVRTADGLPQGIYIVSLYNKVKRYYYKLLRY